jgi:glycerol-3-phosphate dehydrogenase (NAD(P)+)
MKNALVLGAGSWGTALAAMLAQRGLAVQFWGRDAEFMAEMAVTRRNARYMPDLVLPENVEPVSDMTTLRAAELIVFVTPSKAIRSVAETLQSSQKLLDNAVIVSCTKGVELETGLRMSQVLTEFFPEHPMAAFSGPNHAEEIALQKPSAGVVACTDAEVAVQLQSVFNLPYFRCYTSEDITGVEWAGALKNPYAIAAGIAKGLGLGDNAIAALVTRALAEMVRLGVARGGRMETFYGLSGVGDLMVTCYSEHSRNHRVGKLLGQGKSLAEITSSTRMVAEGVLNTLSLWHCAKQSKVRTPLLDEIHAVLYEDKSPKVALQELLGRDPRPELD